MSNIRTYRVNHAMQMISIPLHSTTNSYHLGNNDEVVDEYGYVSQVTNYYPFGAPYADATAVKNADFQPYKYNGKELDLMHGLNTYDYGARQHDPILARWDRIDPLCEKYYSVSPYAYCHNNPIKNIDIDGLYPREILKYHETDFHRANYYTFSKPAAYLLSLVSGVDMKAIENVNVLERGIGRLYPWYSSDKGGGAVTLGSDKYNATITITNNYFEDDKKAYNNNGYGQNLNEWFDLMSHEVVHLNHIGQKGNIGAYLFSFGIDYLENGHDGSKREQEADKGRETYRGFRKYVSDNYGKNALIDIFKSNKNDNEQIRTIFRWWQEFQESQNHQ